MCWETRWMNEKVYKFKKDKNNQGIRAKENIRAGEVVATLGGIVVPIEEIGIYQELVYHVGIQANERFFICPLNREDAIHLGAFNHSCEPNVGILDPITLVAISPIKKDDELRFDYAFSETQFKEFDCNCKSGDCRKKIRPTDWMRGEIWDKYGDYFSPFIKKIRGETIDVELDGRIYKIACSYNRGEGDLIVFIHGLGCSKDSFVGAWNYFGTRGYAFLCIDLLGFGLSDKPEDFSYSISDHARICARVLEKFPQHSSYTIVAHSMGGAIGLMLPQEILDKTSKFINVEGNLIPEDCRLLSKGTAEKRLDEFCKKTIFEYRQTFPLEERYYFSWDMTSPVAFHKSATSLFEMCNTERQLDRFLDLKCDKHYVYGAIDAPKKKILRRLKEEGAEGITTNIAASDHFVMNENPQTFYSYLNKWIRS